MDHDPAPYVRQGHREREGSVPTYEEPNKAFELNSRAELGVFVDTVRRPVAATGGGTIRACLVFGLNAA
jgi:hypothetical protein